MPTPEHTSSRCEVFHTPDDRIVLCEVASRITAAWVIELIKCEYGLHLDQCGLIDPLPDRQVEAVLYGSYFIMLKHGTLVSLPVTVTFD